MYSAEHCLPAKEKIKQIYPWENDVVISQQDPREYQENKGSTTTSLRTNPNNENICNPKLMKKIVFSLEYHQQNFW